ncbi:MAG: helix-turn-helix domain-containing protein, partial [Crocinitomicaceae bacterium]|nr:helix-turn-helix domain-containing protein [Crocinitomicaceae bacterium]
LYFKAIMSNEISVHESGHRILTLLDYLKNDIYKIDGKYTYKVELTRQQIADLSGLRVETVIRTMKDLESKGEIKRIDRKVYR